MHVQPLSYVMVMSLFLSGSAFATTHTVCTGGGCDFPTIQQAIDSDNVHSGHTLLLSAETYSTGLPINTKGKNVKIQGATDPSSGDPTSIIDGNHTHQGFHINHGETTDLKLVHLVIQNCVGNENNHNGGGIVISNSSHATIRKCHFLGNNTFEPNDKASYFPNGGAVHIGSHSGAIFDTCVFHNNKAWGQGGAVACINGSFNMTACELTVNSSILGGSAIFLYKTDSGPSDIHVNITETVIDHNMMWFPVTGAAALGGAVEIVGHSCTMDHVKVRNNHTALGCGGVSVGLNGTVHIVGGVIRDNTTADNVAATGVSNLFGTATTQGVTICGNKGAGTCGTQPGDQHQIGDHSGGGYFECDCPQGDYDEDGDVDLDDYNALGAALGTCPGDMNADGVLDGADLGLLISAWGSCI